MRHLVFIELILALAMHCRRHLVSHCMTRCGINNLYLILPVASPHLWNDGTPMDFARWAPGEPNDKEGTPPQLCVEMYVTLFPGYWNDHLCAQLRSYVCKAKMGK